MKKTFSCLAAIVLGLTISTRSLASECNTNTPGWGSSLGKVSFRTNQTWKVGDQEWSDVVIAENCQKETYNGGTDIPVNFNADCRKNATDLGDLFSWCAVVRFEKQLCPKGWRVPTVNDFIQFDEALGGEGERRKMEVEIIVEFNILGNSYGGWCDSEGNLKDQGFGAFYWTATESKPGKGSRMNFFKDGYSSPQGWDSKALGHAVRCVR
jgi:uncharacterized protein (TIGR02145 family)